MILALLLGQTLSATGIMQDAWHQVHEANTISVTKLQTTEEFPREARTRYWFRKGGYFRAESSRVTDVCNPKEAWTYRSDKKIYQSRKPLPSGFSLAPVVGLDLFGADFPIIGEPREMVWHKRPCIRIELDGRRMTKETKLFVFVAPKTYLPVGVSANLGSMTQVLIFENLVIDPKIDDGKFQFVPPKDWKQVTAGAGGWN